MGCPSDRLRDTYEGQRDVAPCLPKGPRGKIERNQRMPEIVQLIANPARPGPTIETGGECNQLHKILRCTVCASGSNPGFAEPPETKSNQARALMVQWTAAGSWLSVNGPETRLLDSFRTDNPTRWLFTHVRCTHSECRRPAAAFGLQHWEAKRQTMGG